MSGSCSLTVLIWVLFLTDKDLWLQPQWTSEPRRLRASHHSYCMAFGQSSRKRIPKIVVMSTTVTAQNQKQKTVKRQRYRLCLALAEYQILGGKHFLICGNWIRKDLVFENGTTPSEKKYHCQWTLLRGKKPRWNFQNFGNLLQPLALVPDTRKHVVPTEWQVRTVLGDCISKGKVLSIQAPQYRQYVLISDFLDLSNLAIRLEAALAMNWIKDRPEGVKLQNLALATMAGPSMSSLPKNTTADVHYAINNCESLGSGKQLVLHGNSSAIAKDFSPHMAVLRRHFCRICVLYDSPPWETILTSLRPAANPLLGCSSGKPVQDQLAWRFVLWPNLTFSATHLIWERGRWLCSGRKILDVSWSHLRTKEETRPIIHLRQLLPSLIILIFLLDQVDLRNLLDRQVNLANHQDGLQLHHLLVIEKTWDLKVHCVSGYLCDPHHPSLNLCRLFWMTERHHGQKSWSERGTRGASQAANATNEKVWETLHVGKAPPPRCVAVSTSVRRLHPSLIGAPVLPLPTPSTHPRRLFRRPHDPKQLGCNCFCLRPEMSSRPPNSSQPPRHQLA